MKKQTLLKIILILILDIILIGLLSYLISWYRLGLTRVYVSAYDIGEREKIDKLYLKTILVPKAYVSDDIYLEEKDIVLIIKDRYKLLNFTIEKEDLDIDNLDSLISIVEDIKMNINLHHANIEIKDIEQLQKIQKILNTK